MNAADRFAKRTDATGGPDACWPWTGGTTAGYGRFWFEGRMVYAHRHAFTVAAGIDPGDLEVCHRCDNPLCVNPAHLWLGTHAENMRDMGRKGRAIIRHQKVTDAQVREIRQRHRDGETTRELADAYGLNRVTVTGMVNGNSRLRAGGIVAADTDRAAS